MYERQVRQTRLETGPTLFHFLLPDLTTWSIDSNTAAVELHHREAMPSLNLPNFIDTWVASSGVGVTLTNPHQPHLESAQTALVLVQPL